VRPERLLATYTWQPGICWRCERTALVAAVGEVCGVVDAVPLTACGLCVLRLDQIAGAARERNARSCRSLTEPALLPVPVPVPVPALPVPRDERTEAALRAWLDVLMEPIRRPDGSATGTYIVRGSQIPTQKAHR
jgi:hypothetical protein